MNPKISTIRVKVPLAMLMVGFLLTFTSCKTDEPGNQSGNNPAPFPGTTATFWTIEDLSDTIVNITGNQITFLNVTSMAVTYAEVDMGESLDLGMTGFDNTYYVYEGGGLMNVDGNDLTLEEGKVVFTQAGTSVFLSNASSLIKVVIVSMKASAQGNPASSEFSGLEIEANRDANQNIWNPFIQFPNLVVGLYMLPASQGGDSRLVHSWDELNIITTGAGEIQTDRGVLQVEKGSIAFIESGIGHFFTSISSDVDVLIFWEQP